MSVPKKCLQTVCALKPPLQEEGEERRGGRVCRHPRSVLRRRVLLSPPLQGEGWVGMVLHFQSGQCGQGRDIEIKATVRRSCCCADSVPARDRRLPSRSSRRAISPSSAQKRRDCRASPWSHRRRQGDPHLRTSGLCRSSSRTRARRRARMRMWRVRRG